MLCIHGHEAVQQQIWTDNEYVKNSGKKAIATEDK